MNSLRSIKLIVFAFMALSAVPLAGQAETYPSRAITVVVPFPAGGASDVVARIIAEHMGRTLGQQMVIENAAGRQHGIARGGARAHP
jgi:tripartite-type tricarboxylate transporter receptor subunit TctC